MTKCTVCNEERFAWGPTPGICYSCSDPKPKLTRARRNDLQREQEWARFKADYVHLEGREAVEAFRKLVRDVEPHVMFIGCRNGLAKAVVEWVDCLEEIKRMSEAHEEKVDQLVHRLLDERNWISPKNYEGVYAFVGELATENYRLRKELENKIDLEPLREAAAAVRDEQMSGGWDPSRVDRFADREEAIEDLIATLNHLETKR